MSRLYNPQENEKKDFPLPETGVTLARVYQIIYIGERVITYEGQDSNKHQYLLKFETPLLNYKFSEEKGEQPFSIERTYNFSIVRPEKIKETKSAFSKLLYALGGAEKYQAMYSKYTLECSSSEHKVTELINNYITENSVCQIDIVHNNSKDGEKTYANIGETMSIMKGMPIPNRINEIMIFDFYKNYKNLEKFPKWIQEKIQSSITYNDRSHNQDETIKTIQVPVNNPLPTINADDLNVQMPF